MKKIFILIFITLVCSGYKNSEAQDIYKKYKETNTNGDRLYLYASDLLSVFQFDSTIKGTSINAAANFTHWNFNKNLQSAGYGYISENYSSIQLFNQPGTSRNNIFLDLFAGASYYPKPDKFYGTLASSVKFQFLKQDTGSSVIGPVFDHFSTSYLFGALGYGRIKNAGRISVARDFEERLLNTGVLQEKLSQKTILELTELIDKKAYDDYGKYRDSENDLFFQEIEIILLRSGSIKEKLDITNSIRLYEALNNTYRRFVNFPAYIGFQAQVQAQYQIANFTKDKTHEHYATLNGVYGLPLSEQTSLLFSGYVSIPLDTLAASFSQGGENTILGFIPDRNNLSFFNNRFDGIGYYTSQYTAGNTTQYGLEATIYHALTLRCGVMGSAKMTDLIPKTGNSVSQLEIKTTFEYNVSNVLNSYANLNYRKTFDSSNNNLKDTYNFSIGLSARVF